MIEKKMLDALNVQINEEMKSVYIYLAMAADFQDNGNGLYMLDRELGSRQE